MKSEKQPMTHEGKCLIACIQKKLERVRLYTYYFLIPNQIFRFYLIVR